MRKLDIILISQRDRNVGFLLYLWRAVCQEWYPRRIALSSGALTALLFYLRKEKNKWKGLRVF